MSENAKPPSFWLLRPIAIFTRMYPQFPGRGESCIRPALVPQGRSQGSPLHKGHRQLQTALSLSPSLHFPIFPFRPVRTSVLSRRRLPPGPMCKLPPCPLQEGAPEVDQDTLLDCCARYGFEFGFQGGKKLAHHHFGRAVDNPLTHA